MIPFQLLIRGNNSYYPQKMQQYLYLLYLFLLVPPVSPNQWGVLGSGVKPVPIYSKPKDDFIDSEAADVH